MSTPEPDDDLFTTPEPQGQDGDLLGQLALYRPLRATGNAIIDAAEMLSCQVFLIGGDGSAINIGVRRIRGRLVRRQLSAATEQKPYVAGTVVQTGVRYPAIRRDQPPGRPARRLVTRSPAGAVRGHPRMTDRTLNQELWLRGFGRPRPASPQYFVA